MRAKKKLVVASHAPRGFHGDAESAAAAKSSIRNGFAAMEEFARGF